MTKKLFLGLDTSCYTTSCALIDESRTILGDEREILSVPLGDRGLSQSNMVFQHTRALPTLIQRLPSFHNLSGVAVSAFPKRTENSYMPAFLVGKAMAEGIAHAMGCPVHYLSHQEGHVLAALRELTNPIDEPFFVLHLSGGTTELLYCEPKEQLFSLTELGGSIDLKGGQFIDRLGVLMGFPFPAGQGMDLAYAREAETFDPSFEPLPVSVKEGHISFSGPCSEASRRWEKNKTLSKGSMCGAIFHCISQSLIQMISYYLQQRPVNTLIAVGGVMSNTYIRKEIGNFAHTVGMRPIFATPKYSVDNATGVAFGALSMSNEKEL